MSKFKAFFHKVGNYIKNTAWIQPLLIVIVIFVILFSLNPITNAIRTGWTNLTTTNHMDKISYKEYVETVKSAKDDDKYIIVFSQKNCDVCPIFYKSMNEYLKKTYKSADFKIYNVDLSTKSSKVKIDGVSYTQYKDASLGLVSPISASKENILKQDYLRQLDERIVEFSKSAFIDVDGSSNDLSTVANSTYTYVSTPLVIWYKGSHETRISNNFTSSVTLNSDGNKATVTTFKNYIEDFGGDTDSTLTADWNETFDLTYSEYKKIKEAF